ncbi:MAG TPA: hypothetical protein VFP36_05040 [Usitatibacter sp.]|nr:hypothetical protein [Usitatibacter sp.]
MNFLTNFVMGCALCLVALTAYAQPASSQQRHAQPVLSLAQAERSAAQLHRGMTSDDVRGLLGKPKRTGLREDGVRNAASQGALRWTYVWNDTSGPATLHVDFVSDLPEQWHVHGWEWSSY